MNGFYLHDAEKIQNAETLQDVEKQMRILVNQYFHNAPFFTHLRQGLYNYEQIRYFAIQYFHYSKNFPRILGAAISAMSPVDEWWIPLADNLWDEAGRGIAGRSHAELYKTFLFSVDPAVPLNEFGLPVNPPVSTAVTNAIDTFITFFRQATPLQAMSAVGFGSEFFAGEVMGAIGQGLRHPNYTSSKPFDITFWNVHADDHEPHHYQLCKNILDTFTDKEELEEMLKTGVMIAKSEARMYNQLHKEMLEI
ncbi:iron-containing redox enzyme family protein [Fodinisporobacter ferrooxydans]|uniref:Iron-containing redox enzyme family protein n=1 Tax=Fodinisporobacter ferrooxydans TaxID=2901836 RepID=A0ABY4CLZ9_9BACL|nr:iron-containing redox enzyme family protein [Alicyclobacillaceae bacterium MYW30-H2]